MTAKELFKEIGYVRHDYKNSIEYFMQNKENRFVYEVVFDLVEEVYTAKVWKISDLDTTQPVDFLLHQAIHQQMIELGWVE